MIDPRYSRSRVATLLHLVAAALAQGAHANEISVLPPSDSDPFPFSLGQGDPPGGLTDEQLWFTKVWNDLRLALDYLAERNEILDLAEARSPSTIADAMTRIELTRILLAAAGRRHAAAHAEFTRLDAQGARIRLQATARLQADEWDEENPDIQIRKGVSYSQADKAASGDPEYVAHKDRTAAAAIAAKEAEIAFTTACMECVAATKILDGISVSAVYPTPAPSGLSARDIFNAARG